MNRRCSSAISFVLIIAIVSNLCTCSLFGGSTTDHLADYNSVADDIVTLGDLRLEGDRLVDHPDAIGPRSDAVSERDIFLL